ncbi:MAG TPA: pyridoxamine 5'-phosphate oxidase family protein [Anaerolineales bacterium]|nr:pyridoxamine 5'-phosphate oxidase family protein [Anaerolineales bacterium]
MDSINRNQPEDNREDLRGQEAVYKIKEMVEDAENCFFCSAIATGDSNGDRPMNVRQVDDEGNLWFLSASDSRKNQELALDPSVRLYFQGSKHSDFMQLNGQATVTRDRAKIKELWSPMIQTWFTEGVDDPRITVIKVTPSEGYYWDTKHGNAVAGIKILIGAVLRKTLDDSVEGKLDV